MYDKNDTRTTNEAQSKNVKKIQWLEANGKFDTVQTSDGHSQFVTKDELKAAYLTDLGAAVTLSLEGYWHYVLNSSSLHLKEGETCIDNLSIASEEGISHTLQIHIQADENEFLIDKVDYLQEKEKSLIQEDNKEEPPIFEEKNFSIENAIEEAELDLEKEDKEEVNVEQDENSMAKEIPLDEVVSIEDESVLEKNMSSRPVLDSSEKELESFTEKIDEEEMLAKVHALMLVKKEEARLKAEEQEIQRIQEEEQRQKEAEQREQEERRQILEAKKEKERAAKEVLGDDERLLKLQALMNAPKQLDVLDIEIVGDDKPAKVEKIEEDESSIEESEVPKQDLPLEEDETCLKGKITLETVEGNEIYKSNTYLEGFSLDIDGNYRFDPHEISYDYLGEKEVADNTVEISVIQGNGEKLLGSIHLTVKKLNGELNLKADQGEFKQDNALATENFQEMSLEELAGSEEEFSHHSQIQEAEEAHQEGHLAVIFDALEDGANLHSDGTLGITILLPTGAQAGEAIIVNGSEFIITGPESDAGTLLYSVYPDDEVEVSYRDGDNNISDSVRAQANHHSLDILEFTKAPEIMGEVGSQSVHASIGEPMNVGEYWGIVNDARQIVHYSESEISNLKVDQETGELEYRYYEGSGPQKYGKNLDNKVCEKFIISLGNKPYAQLEVNINIQIQSIHGYSGQEIDSTTIEEIKLLKYDPSLYEVRKTDTNAPTDNNIGEMLEAGLASNKAKISKVMLEIYEAKSTGVDTSEAKKKLQILTDQKTHLVDKLNSLN